MAITNAELERMLEEMLSAEEVFYKEVKNSGNGGAVAIPRRHLGKKVKVIILKATGGNET